MWGKVFTPFFLSLLSEITAFEALLKYLNKKNTL